MVNKNLIGGWALLMLALMILVLPMQWVLAAVLAAMFHELCHYGAARLCGGNVARLRVGTFGAQMEVWELTNLGELVCALAGPLGSLSLLLLAHWLPRTAVCAGFQGLYNLLPVYPFDGGRALRCSAALLLPDKVGGKLCEGLECLCFVGLALLGFYGTFLRGLGLLPLILATSIILRAKIPCKPGIFSVQ